MTLQAAIMLGIRLSIVLTVFALGLGATMREVTYLFRHPCRFAKSLFAIDIVMPLFTLLMLAVTNLRGPIAIALAALAVSPVPPIMPRKAAKAGGTDAYIIGLLVAAAAVALVFVPLSLELLGRVLGVNAHVPVSTVVMLMMVTVLGPLLAGVAARSIWPVAAERFAAPLAKFAGILLILCALPVIPGALPQIWSLVGDGSLAAFAAFVFVGLVVGHLLGGPDPSDRTVLAIATASRHPGMAIAIAVSSFPAEKLVLPGVIMYLIVGALISIPYVVWRKRAAAASSPHVAS